jgi:hypothetical protein
MSGNMPSLPVVAPLNLVRVRVKVTAWSGEFIYVANAIGTVKGKLKPLIFPGFRRKIEIPYFSWRFCAADLAHFPESPSWEKSGLQV